MLFNQPIRHEPADCREPDFTEPTDDCRAVKRVMCAYLHEVPDRPRPSMLELVFEGVDHEQGNVVIELWKQGFESEDSAPLSAREHLVDAQSADVRRTYVAFSVDFDTFDRERVIRIDATHFTQLPSMPTYQRRQPWMVDETCTEIDVEHWSFDRIAIEGVGRHDSLHGQNRNSFGVARFDERARSADARLVKRPRGDVGAWYRRVNHEGLSLRARVFFGARGRRDDRM